MNATPLASRAPAHPGFVGLDVLPRFAADPILIGTHHAGPQLVENLDSSLVARPPELPLELDGRHARCLAGDQIGRPKPDRERRVCTFHDGAGGKTRVAVAMTTPENPGTIGKAVWLAGRAAEVADEPIVPTGVLKVGRACRFVWEQSLELRQGARKRQITSLKHVDSHGRPRLA